MEREIETALENLVRIGTVTDVDKNRHRARVKFQDLGITSGWLYVLSNIPVTPDYDVTQETQSRSGGGGDAAFASHTHEIKYKQWMPNVNDTVLVLYLPVPDGDGFVVGGIA